MSSEVQVIKIEDRAYPELLRNIEAPPKALYVRGKLPDVDSELAIAVIGTRYASPYGLKMSRNISYEIAKCGGIVVSGLTLGIDMAAAEGALLAGGRCIAVLGIPVENENSELAKEILRNGALVSEYPEGTKPCRAFFRERNRISSGLSGGVVVVEAPEKSGTAFFVETALNQGKEIFAVPGNADCPNSAGTLKLIKEGAKLVTRGWEVAEEFPYKLNAGIRLTAGDVPVESRAKESKKTVDKEKTDHYIDITDLIAGLNRTETEIVKAVNGGCRSADEIIARTALSVSDVLQNITMLQIKGILVKSASGFEIKK